jgi:hypothetical protein
VGVLRYPRAHAKKIFLIFARNGIYAVNDFHASTQ